jgi:hypothetical protein
MDLLITTPVLTILLGLAGAIGGVVIWGILTDRWP